jgi:AraC-like DNA-binding protein
MGALQLVSTESVQPSERTVLFKDTLQNLLGRLEIQTLPRTPFMAEFRFVKLGDASLCWLRADGHRVERIGGMHSEGRLHISFQIKQTVCFSSERSTLVLPPGQWTLSDTGKPGTVFAPEGTETLVLLLPREKVLSKYYNVDNLLMRPFSGTAGVGKLASQFGSSVFTELPKLDADSVPDMIDTLCHLIRLTMKESAGEEAAPSSCEILRERIRSYIKAHLRDPELSLERIACAFKCTKRYLHKVFEAEGTSIWEYIWQLRLGQCREELLNPDCQHKSITDIAFSWGFSSSAHFSTAFRQRFGAPPRSYRKGEGQRELPQARPGMIAADIPA